VFVALGVGVHGVNGVGWTTIHQVHDLMDVL
jgi:hypothetical protein